MYGFTYLSLTFDDRIIYQDVQPKILVVGVPFAGNRCVRRENQLQCKIQGRGQNGAYFQERVSPGRQRGIHPGQYENMVRQ